MNNKNLKYIIQGNGFTQQEIADKLDVKQGTVSNWICGKRNPSKFQIPKLANLLEITTDELIDILIKNKERDD